MEQQKEGGFDGCYRTAESISFAAIILLCEIITFPQSLKTDPLVSLLLLKLSLKKEMEMYTLEAQERTFWEKETLRPKQQV